MIFCKATYENVLLIRDIFHQYGSSSGQVVNPSKSRVYFGTQVSGAVKHYFSNALYFVEGAIPFGYLGVPIFLGMPKMMHLRSITDKIIMKFDRWSGNLLSLARRVYLVNSVIISSLMHSTMLYRWPRKLLKQVDRAMRNFIWKGNISQLSHGNVAWSRVCAPHSEGGLGIRDIRSANEAFLFKLAWEILKEKDIGLKFILQRHSTADESEVKYYISSSIWHGIDRIRQAIKADSCWVPGQNSSVKFWTDNWLGYCIADKVGIPASERAGLNQCISAFHSENEWILGDAFAEEFPQVCADIVAIKIASIAKDELVWTRHKSREITSKAAYDRCRSHFLTVSWGAWLWDSFIPPS